MKLLELCKNRHGGSFDDYNYSIFFLAALIATHTKEVFGVDDADLNEIQLDLLQAAKAFSACLTDITSVLNTEENKDFSCIPENITVNFLQLTKDCSDHFNTWVSSNIQYIFGKEWHLTHQLENIFARDVPQNMIDEAKKMVVRMRNFITSGFGITLIEELDKEILTKHKASALAIQVGMNSGAISQAKGTIILDRLRQRILFYSNEDQLQAVNEQLNACRLA